MIKIIVEIEKKADLLLSGRIVDSLERLGVPSVRVRLAATRKKRERFEADEEANSDDIYSDLISIQRKVKQHLSTVDDVKKN